MASREPPPLVWLTSFVAVVEHGTFTAAAQALNRAQPRISAHIAALERNLGSTLLIRGTRGVQLTEAGSALLPHARGVLREIRHGVDAVRAVASTVQGTLAVGSYPGAMAVVIAPIVARYRSRFPGVAVELHEADPAVLESMVAAGDIDLAVRTADVPQRHHNVPSVPLFDEPIRLLVRVDHPQSRATTADPAILQNETVIVSGDPETGWSDYRDRLDRIGVEPYKIITVVQPTTVVALVREGLGVGLLGALAAKITVTDDEVRAVRLPRPLWLREIRIYQRADAEPRPPVESFMQLLRNEAPDLTAGASIWPDPNG